MIFRFVIPAMFTIAAMVPAAAADPAQGKGTVNMVDAAGHKVNLSHEAIPAIGWPPMKMNFPVAPTVDLKDVKAGAQVAFTLAKNKAGAYEIQSITPVAK